MRPTEILQREHRVIEQELDCMERLVGRVQLGGAFEAREAGEIVDFLATFADRCHHGKEEKHLFRLLEERGFSAEVGPNAAMRREHEIGRAYVRAMREQPSGTAAGNDEAPGAYCAAALGFVKLLREHIGKEDNVLFVMAERAFSPEDDRALMADFEIAEHDDMKAWTHETYLALAQRLAQHFGVTGRVVNACCCAHAERGPRVRV